MARAGDGIPIHAIGGVSAGSIIAAAYASGATPDEIERVARSMKFSDVARWTISRMGLAHSRRMDAFLSKLLKTNHFEEMRIPLAVVASDICAGAPVIFRDHGDVVLPIRASCAYPGLFQPIQEDSRCLVDGMVAMEVPAAPLRQMGATHVISVALPNASKFDAANMLSVVNRCFQMMAVRSERDWRDQSTLVIEPPCGDIGWDGFAATNELLAAGERAGPGVHDADGDARVALVARHVPCEGVRKGRDRVAALVLAAKIGLGIRAALHGRPRARRVVKRGIGAGQQRGELGECHELLAERLVVVDSVGGRGLKLLLMALLE